MPIFQTDNLLQIKEKDFIEKYKPTLNKTWNTQAHK